MIFKYDPAVAAPELQTKGYAHLKDVLSDDFVAYLTGFLDACLAEDARESRSWNIKGKKRQFVFDFPSDESAEAFRRGLAALTGIAPDDFTVAERHLKVYDDHAAPFPAPHKDRAASHYSIGLPIRLPEGSTVCAFPDLDPGENTEDHAVFLGQEDPETIRALYDSDAARMLNESVGDLVVFWGSRLYHERVRGAGTAILYIKANGVGDDPLGENIYRRAAEPV
ncbi:hypothetical protein P1J78_02670 [Psychromarinibacter sp. C21-152]|uniref:Uncharacterized protein n=1 Tax=Psychromarinibacter sediminicola TaxID=3033385 RepID=A0AAE3NPJ6_9RHOB|nr:hypothetical protein [Psychromarinibacter sediminicola]MDF0599626.1 hypothetical protein [Psychromarinibacter sediminicola]